MLSSKAPLPTSTALTAALAAFSHPFCSPSTPCHSHPNLPVLVPHASSLPASQKAPCHFGFSSVETVSPQTPHLCLFFLRVVWDSYRLVVQGKSRPNWCYWAAGGADRRVARGLHPPVFSCDHLQTVKAAFLLQVFYLHRTFFYYYLFYFTFIF